MRLSPRWGLLAFSLGLHALLLRLPAAPLGTLQLPEPPSPEAIPVTQLPVVSPVPLPPAPISPQTQPAQPKSSPARVTAAAPTPALPLDPQPKLNQPGAQPLANPRPPSPDPTADLPPTANLEANGNSGNPPLQPADWALEGGVAFATDASLHVAGSESGCLGLESCRTVTNVRRDSDAAAQVVALLVAQGHRVAEQDDNVEDRRGVIIYQVTHPDWPAGEVRILHVFQQALGAVSYVITPAGVRLEDLQPHS